MASEENLADLRRGLAVDSLMTSCLEKARRPQKWQVQAFYRANRQAFYTPALAHVSHLVKNFGESGRDEQDIAAAVEAMRMRVVRGEKFACVALEESDCPEHGGDLGYITQGTMVEEFDAIVFSAPLGELTPAFRTCFGFHTALVHDRRPEGIRELKEVEPEIETLLLRKAQELACGALFEKLRRTARIEEVCE
jgi:parvulin-like peptidyl-prolyl isomerase